MCLVCKVAYATTAGTIALTSSTTPVSQSNVEKIRENIQSAVASRGVLSSLPKEVSTPKWYQDRLEAEGGSEGRETANIVVKYTVSTHGNVRSNLSEFASLANETLNHAKGWSRLGVRFEQVESGGSFSLILSEAARVPDFSPDGCDTIWSCRVGSNVIINDDRWTSASDAWNASGGGMRDYRHMVINHEVGHWLGHGHEYCTSSGSPAAVMQQQSIDLQGCAFNPWPLDSEIWSTQLGIDKRN